MLASLPVLSLALVETGRLTTVLELGKVKLCRAMQGLSCWLGVVMWLDTHSLSFCA